jgi:hypothetical protein
VAAASQTQKQCGRRHSTKSAKTERAENGERSDMNSFAFNSLRYVLSPNGQHLNLSTLPEPRGTRWVVRRKAEVVAAVKGGILGLDEACERYALTIDEFKSWEAAVRNWR